jgi:glycosyltransferase involved in cell wall biosynthesis
MRILQLITRRQRRGAEVFAVQLADALTMRGNEVVVASLYQPPGDPLSPLNAAYVDLAPARPKRFDMGLLRQLESLIREVQPDLVQANGSDTLKYSVFARRRATGTWPLVYRNISITSHWLRYPGHRLWVQWLLRQVDFTVAVSKMASVDLQRVFGVPSSRLVTIPIGTHIPADPDRPRARSILLGTLGLDANAEILMHIGNFSPEKNHLWLLHAFQRIHSHRPTAHLVLIGDGALRAKVEAQVRSSGLERAVHLLGSRSDAADLTAAADILVMPSLIEGIPGAILEAAAHATPCVANRVGSIDEALEDGKGGLLVPAGDADAFVNAVMSLLSDPDRRVALGRAAHDFVARQYEMGTIVDLFAELYSRLAPGRISGRWPPAATRGVASDQAPG